ncbi:DUF1836 domain-containing protein [Vallitalea guaymasensis]|uniref:DUF1836 domain-containing protein n=2 Tax=Vallitalea guaymasensis TaxID=1185412 RepID=A0A8J8M875_9FIRM|nr:DUF1836 domain-containing protein [Vallitalea guaymasensis]QUH28161.1 DUF1836 domain-containing protein [Vallitalea guaymasensis]
MNYLTYMKKLLNQLENMDHVYSKDIPNISLYMDQVTTFMDDNLGSLKRRDEDKILTKTMINNYSKNHILPPPIKKKYSPDHMIMLIFIYYSKHVLSITDIQKLLSPIKDMLENNSDFSLEEFYDKLLNVQKDEFKLFKQHIENTIEVAVNTFKDSDIEGKDKDMLELFNIIYLLTLQATAQKHLAEKLIDRYFKQSSDPKENKGK